MMRTTLIALAALFAPTLMSAVEHRTGMSVVEHHEIKVMYSQDWDPAKDPVIVCLYKDKGLKMLLCMDPAEFENRMPATKSNDPRLPDPQ